MEMWCSDDMVRDSWDWVGPPAWVRACFNSPEWGGGSSPVRTEPPQIVLFVVVVVVVFVAVAVAVAVAVVVVVMVVVVVVVVVCCVACGGCGCGCGCGCSRRGLECDVIWPHTTLSFSEKTNSSCGGSPGSRDSQRPRHLPSPRRRRPLRRRGLQKLN